MNKGGKWQKYNISTSKLWYTAPIGWSKYATNSIFSCSTKCRLIIKTLVLCFNCKNGGKTTKTVPPGSDWKQYIGTTWKFDNFEDRWKNFTGDTSSYRALLLVPCNSCTWRACSGKKWWLYGMDFKTIKLEIRRKWPRAKVSGHVLWKGRKQPWVKETGHE